jgi:hypothetical protein
LSTKPLNLVFRLFGAMHEPLLAHSVTRTYSFPETSLKIEGEWP